MPQSFHELAIWRNGYKLVLQVYELTRNFPRSEKYGLTDQIKRSANATIGNIAESRGRHSYNDKIRVLYQARGELFETRSHLQVTNGVQYISEEMFIRLDKEYEGLLVGLNRYINYLSKARKN